MLINKIVIVLGIHLRSWAVTYKQKISKQE